MIIEYNEMIKFIIILLILSTVYVVSVRDLKDKG